jgi:hypothetical protein
VFKNRSKASGGRVATHQHVKVTRRTMHVIHPDPEK